MAPYATLNYRALEILMGSASDIYSMAIDIWSAGVIMAEVVRGSPLFPGNTEFEFEILAVHSMFRLLGTPSEGASPGLAQLPGFKVGTEIQWNGIAKLRYFPILRQPFRGGMSLIEKRA